MKKNLFNALALVGVMLLSAGQSSFAQITTPRAASPAAKVSQTVGISTVTVKYSRPSVNERDIWGALVPYGWNKFGFGAGNDSPWRAGANENTVIHFSHDVNFGGKDIKAGAYALFFVLNEDNSGSAVLSNNTSSWGSFWYNPSEDAARVDISTREITYTERLTYDFQNIDRTSAELVLNWEEKQFPVKVEFDVDGIVIANAKDELRGTAGFSWNGPLSAANYAAGANKDLDQALIWVNQAIAQNNSFQTLQVKSRILGAMGKPDEAKETVESALNVATEVQLNAYGYQLAGQQNFSESIRVLKMAVDKNPKSPNAHDSLGEIYFLSGDKKTASKHFKKALSLNPAANVKANSEKYLKQISGK